MIDAELVIYFFFFFFSSRRRHTRYIGDWSSDVCSSDLLEHALQFRIHGGYAANRNAQLAIIKCSRPRRRFRDVNKFSLRVKNNDDVLRRRSEERRVGKEWSSRRSAWC